MPRGRIAMHLMKDVLRLHQECGRSQREVARSCGVSVGTVNGLLRKAREAGLGWPLPADLDEQQLHERLYGRCRAASNARGGKPSISRPCTRSCSGASTCQCSCCGTPTARSTRTGTATASTASCTGPGRRAGNWSCCSRTSRAKLFVDYCGASVPVYLATGVRQAVAFVAVLGASSYSYVEASWGQDLEAWVGAHVRTFEDLGGAPEVVVPDNLKSGVTKACRYEPVTNRTYREMAPLRGGDRAGAPVPAKDKASRFVPIGLY